MARRKQKIDYDAERARWERMTPEEREQELARCTRESKWIPWELFSSEFIENDPATKAHYEARKDQPK